MTTSQPVRRASARQVTLWVDADIVERWDQFVQSHGRAHGHNTRTSMIISAVNEFMLANTTPADTTTETTRIIEARFAELQQLLQQKTVVAEPDQALVNDPHVRARILRAIEMQPATSQDLAFLLAVDEHVIIEALVALRDDQIARIDRDGVWHAAE